ncbi:hypothetical protein ACLB2K_004430 [Fragaria x ananassa]
MTNHRKPKRYKSLFSWFQTDTPPSGSESGSVSENRRGTENSVNDVPKDVPLVSSISIPVEECRSERIEENVRRTYVVLGPYQPQLSSYPSSNDKAKVENLITSGLKIGLGLSILYRWTKHIASLFVAYILADPRFVNTSSVSNLSQRLVESRKSALFPMIYRLICLVWTLPVSTATTERTFSSMNIIKSRLRNKMEDDFLDDLMVLYIEKEFADSVDNDFVIQEFEVSGTRSKTQRVELSYRQYDDIDSITASLHAQEKDQKSPMPYDFTSLQDAFVMYGHS